MKYFVSWSPEVFLVILSLSLCEAASLWIALLICSSVSWQTDACRWNNGNSWEITNSTKHTDTSLGIWDPMKSFTLYFYIINREKSIQYSEDQVNPGQKYTLRWLESFCVENLWLIVFEMHNSVSIKRAFGSVFCGNALFPKTRRCICPILLNACLCWNRNVRLDWDTNM